MKIRTSLGHRDDGHDGLGAFQETTVGLPCPISHLSRTKTKGFTGLDVLEVSHQGISSFRASGLGCTGSRLRREEVMQSVLEQVIAHHQP